MYYVYLLRLKNGEYYTGFTGSLRERVKKHFQLSTITTKLRKPVKLVFYAAFIDKKLAIDFERYLKTSSGFAFRKKRLINFLGR